MDFKHPRDLHQRPPLAFVHKVSLTAHPSIMSGEFMYSVHSRDPLTSRQQSKRPNRARISTIRQHLPSALFTFSSRPPPRFGMGHGTSLHGSMTKGSVRATNLTRPYGSTMLLRTSKRRNLTIELPYWRVLSERAQEHSVGDSIMAYESAFDTVLRCLIDIRCCSDSISGRRKRRI